MFNPAPACLIDEELMKAIDILVVNELEASFISGIDYTDNNLEEIAETLLKAGTSNVVITLGSQGAYMKNAKETIQLPGCKVNAIDTIAAGDTFAAHWRSFVQKRNRPGSTQLCQHCGSHCSHTLGCTTVYSHSR